MALPVSALGRVTSAVVHEVDSRWLMAYAASVGALDGVYLDTRRDGGIEGHPLFPVCVEWPAVLAARDVLEASGLTRAEARQGVHLSHDLRPERPVRPGDRLTTVATVAGITTHRAGALVQLDLVTTDAHDDVVARTRMGTLYRGVEVGGTDQEAPDVADAPATMADPPTAMADAHQLGAGTAHLYTECSRIWNPIHTDARTASAAGLPGIILHGTATLAMVTNDVLSLAGAGPAAVRRLRARFGAVVALPSAVQTRLRGRTDDATTIWFDAVGPDAEPVIRHGTMILEPPPAPTAEASVRG